VLNAAHICHKTVGRAEVLPVLAVRHDIAAAREKERQSPICGRPTDLSRSRQQPMMSPRPAGCGSQSRLVAWRASPLASAHRRTRRSLRSSGRGTSYRFRRTCTDTRVHATNRDTNSAAQTVGWARTQTTPCLCQFRRMRSAHPMCAVSRSERSGPRAHRRGPTDAAQTLVRDHRFKVKLACPPRTRCAPCAFV
jgi:hypothetical protein